MRFFCITMGDLDSCCYFYVDADRIEFGTNTYTKKLGDIRFYLGSKQVCFVDSHKVYRVQEFVGEDELKVLFQEGEVLC